MFQIEHETWWNSTRSQYHFYCIVFLSYRIFPFKLNTGKTWNCISICWFSGSFWMCYHYNWFMSRGLKKRRTVVFSYKSIDWCERRRLFHELLCNPSANNKNNLISHLFSKNSRVYTNNSNILINNIFFLLHYKLLEFFRIMVKCICNWNDKTGFS